MNKIIDKVTKDSFLNSNQKQLVFIIIDHIQNNKDKTKTFSVEDFLSAIPKELSFEENDVLDGIFYLAQFRIGLLKKCFLVWDKEKDEYVSGEPYHEGILKMFKNECFGGDLYNPISKEKLSEQELGNQILLQFQLTDYE